MYLNTYFEFDNIKSIDMDVGAYHIEEDMVQSPFGISRVISENITNKVIEFDMTLAKIHGLKWTYDERRKISQWLFKDDYKPLRFCDNYFLVYYVMFSESPLRYDIGNNEGYIKIHVKCQNPYCFGDYGIEYHDLSKQNNNIIKIKNISNVNDRTYPIFCFENLENQDIIFNNYNNKSKETIITGLKKGEYVILDNNKQDIETNLENTYRWNNFNKQWFYLNTGVNKIQILGRIKLKIMYEFPISM